MRLRLLFWAALAVQFLVIPVSATAASNPNAIAVIIANSDYQNEIPPVEYAGNDGDAMKSFLIDVLGYRAGNIIELRDASQAQILAVFGNEKSHQGKLWSWIKPGRSDVFVYYSGHGAPGLKDKQGYLLPVDADPATVEINGYSLDLLYRNLAKLGARTVTIMLDACFSGASEAGLLIKAASPVFVRATASDVAEGITVLTAAQGDQIASWDREAKLGLFTNFALKGFYGEADGGDWGNGDGRVTLSEVRAYLDDEMSYAARRRFTRVQQASAVGNPQTVLVPRVPEKPRQVAAFTAPEPVKKKVSVTDYSLYGRWRRSSDPQDLVLEPEIPISYGSPPASVKGEPVNWLLLSSFYGDIPILGRAAIGFIQRVEKYSDGSMHIQFSQPGQPTSGRRTTSEVAEGDVPISYATAAYDADGNPELLNFSAVPFGLNMQEALDWYLSGSHDKMLAKAYEHINVVPMACALLGAEGGGYFPRPIADIKDYAGLKLRSSGMPGRVHSRLGSTVKSYLGDEMMLDLEEGRLDAVEFSTPYIDRAFEYGMKRFRTNYHYPAWHQPSYFSHIFVNRNSWDTLTSSQQEVIRFSCRENIVYWAEKDYQMARETIRELREEKINIKPFPRTVVESARQAWQTVLAEQLPKFKQIHTEVMRFKKGSYIFK